MHDVIIIGTGAGGGTLAHRLAPSGKRILLLERGDYLPRETENWDAREVFVQNRYKAHEKWLDRKGRSFAPGIHYYVGGNTKVYGAALLRFRAQDFGELRHHGGLSPAWPVSYDELEPYYLQAEQLYQVHGQRGLDPTEPYASGPYPFPAVRHEPRILDLHEDLRRNGLSPFPLPLGLRLDESRPHQSACIRCGACDGFPCPLNAKADAQVTCVDPALVYPNVELLTGARVERLLTSPSGRDVTGVEVTRQGERLVFRAHLVVVAAGAINSAALLLRSSSDRHPRGLANGSDTVGRHYMAHNNTAFLAISRHPNPTRFQKTLGLNDFYFGEDGFPYPMGHIQMLGKSSMEMLEAGAPAFAPGLALEVMAEHALDFWMTSEDLPDPDNRVTVEPDGQIRLSYQPNNLAGHQRLEARLKSLLRAIGCQEELLPMELYLGKRIPLAGTAHQCGTVRFGTDPRSSALDPHCRAHEVDNLYVVDGSFFPSSAATNPALTIMANALRVGDHLLERLSAKLNVPEEVAL